MEGNMKRMDGHEKLQLMEEDLAADVDDFMKDSKRIRRVLEEIGQTKAGPLGTWINILFSLAVIVLIAARFVFGWLDNILSLELGVLLVSVKIIWMMRMQERYNHFLFWMLHSMEFRLNLILKKVEGDGKDGS
jgi:hypothetical protein